jgi:OHCU decarboxylase
MTLADLNALNEEQFTQFLGQIFEDSPWVMRRAWHYRSFSSLDALHTAAIGCLADSTHEDQLALLRAHPDLGTRAKISEASQEEQAGVGLDQLTSEEFSQLHRLNTAYRQRFGFPFLYAVKGSTKHDILSAMEKRIENSQQQEFQEALRQVHRIARFRLEAIITGTKD